jgi:putative alpha-1,2-mannosidase
VWASLGLFPVAGQNVVLVNAPSFEQATLELGGSTLSIETSGFVEPTASDAPQFVQSMRLDGLEFDRSWVTGNELRDASTLHVELGPHPSAWATTSRPPSTGTAPPSRSSTS